MSSHLKMIIIIIINIVTSTYVNKQNGAGVSQLQSENNTA
jgi:hypothetical protein